uniref:Deacetylase sirtuin-type domain-containing protein n=1 Tax=Alexandrium monilatum TaxID=311494 RepID=A0A7S4QFH6_9DINO
MVAACAEAARPGFDAGSADEFRDTPEALAAKVRLAGRLVRGARCCVAYTGAGLSTAAGIADYATKAAGSAAPRARAEERAWPTLAPTQAHLVLAALQRDGLLHGWVQQNHDGLPQRAGVPQAAVNEIHGSWFDPTNPTVGFGEPLREDLFAELLAQEMQCDVCLALGTSLCDTPSTADRIALTPALRALGRRPRPPGEPPDSPGGGLVIVSLQRTRLDEVAAVRIYATLDDAFAMLAESLGLRVAALEPQSRGGGGHASQGGGPEGLHFPRPGSEAVLAGGPDRGCPVCFRSWTESGDLELQLLGSRGAPPRRALLGRWWLGDEASLAAMFETATDPGAAAAPAPGAGAPGTTVDPPPTLTSLLASLPPWAAAMLGLPPAPAAGMRPVAAPTPEVAQCMEGLWEGSAACTDASPHRVAQPLRLVIAACGEAGTLIGAGYSAWPAAGATGPAGSVFFVIQGETRSDGRVRLVQRWERSAAAPEEEAPCELLGQLSRTAAGGLLLAGAWRRGPGQPRLGPFTLRRTPARWAGRWEAGGAGSGTASEPWALAVLPPLLFGAAPALATGSGVGAPASTLPLARPRLLRGALVAGRCGGLSAYEAWLYSELPCRGSALHHGPGSLTVEQLIGTVSCCQAGHPRLDGAGGFALRLAGPPRPPPPTLHTDTKDAVDELASALRSYCRSAPR